MCSRKVLTMSLNLRAEWEFFLIFEYATEVIACRDEKMLDALDSVDIKCGTDNFTAMKQFIDLTTGHMLPQEKTSLVALNMSCTIIHEYGLKKPLKRIIDSCMPLLSSHSVQYWL